MVGATGFERMQLMRGDTVQHCYRLLATQPVRLILSPQPSALSPQRSCSPLSPGLQPAHPVQPSALSPQPSALSPQPSALSPHVSPQIPQPSALSPQPSALSPQPSALSPQPSALSPQPSLRTSCRSLTARADRPSGASAFSAAVASGSVGCRLSQNSFTQSITFAARPTTASRAPRAAVWGAVRQLAWHPAARSGPKEEVQVVLKEPRSRARPE